MSDMMSLNTDAVYSAVNQISIAIEDINVRANKFLELLKANSEAAHGKNAVFNEVTKRTMEDVQSIHKIQEIIDELNADLDKYVQAIAEADDASAFRV